MNNTQAMKLELIKETDPEWAKDRRTAYLCNEITEMVIETWQYMAKYEVFDACDQTEMKLIYSGYIQENLTKLCKLQGKVIALRDNKKGNITDEMIQNAREYPFQELYEFKHNMALCPFHPDKNPSMSLKNNRVRCWSCMDKGMDTIEFVMKKDGLSFTDAVKRLQ